MDANPYAQGWREWDERYADLVLGKRNWWNAAVSLALVVVRAGGGGRNESTRVIIRRGVRTCH